MKYAGDRPYSDPEKAARRLMEHAQAFEPIRGRIYIEKLNGPFLFADEATPTEYTAGHDAGRRTKPQRGLAKWQGQLANRARNRCKNNAELGRWQTVWS